MDITSSVYGFIQDIEKNPSQSLISLTVANKDNILFNFKKEPYIKNGKQLVFSVTKSFVSLAIGMIYDKGLIQLDDSIMKYLGAYAPKDVDSKMKDITIRHLLTMTSGVVDENIYKMIESSDFRTYYLSQTVKYTPGTHYHYHSLSTHMLSAIFTEVTGLLVEDYLEENLLKPIGIYNFKFARANEGITFGGFGLSIDEIGLTKLGQLLLNHGNVKGVQYISKAYLDLATSPQAIKQDYVGNPGTKSIGFQYGFQFHVSPNLSYRADGAFGQVVVIYKGLAIITTMRYTDYEYLYEMIYKHFNEEPVVKTSPDALDQYLKTLTFKIDMKDFKGPLNQSYTLKDNPLKIKEVEFNHHGVILTYQDLRKNEFNYNQKQDTFGKSFAPKDFYFTEQLHFVNASWVEKDVLKLQVLYVETPIISDYYFKFMDGTLELEFKTSGNFLVGGFKVTSI